MMTISDKTLAAVRKERTKNPLMSMRTALAIARSKGAADRRGWEHDHGERYKREQDGFTLKLTSEVESEMPQDGDMGHYVEGVSSDYSYEWGGNYPQPTEELPLHLPYTSFYSAGYSRSPQNVTPYFVPDGVEDWYDEARRCGQSKSVAWDYTKQMVEDTISAFFGGPLTYMVVTVTVYKKDIELASASIGTSIIGYDDDYLFEVADETGIVEDALDDAKETLTSLREEDE